MSLIQKTARLLDGAAVGAEIRNGLRPRIAAFIEFAGRPPTLGLLLAGDDPGSAIYVRSKIKQSEELGMGTQLAKLPATARFSEAREIVSAFNQNVTIDRDLSSVSPSVWHGR